MLTHVILDKIWQILYPHSTDMYDPRLVIASRNEQGRHRTLPVSFSLQLEESAAIPALLRNAEPVPRRK